MEKEISRRFLKGIPASPGIVMGRACVFQDILYLVERRNMEEGYEVIVARNGKEALEKYDQETPPLVVLDIWTPITDGLGNP